MHVNVCACVCVLLAREELGRQQPPTAGDLREFSNLVSGNKGKKKSLNHGNVTRKRAKLKHRGERN